MGVDAGSIYSAVRIKLTELQADIASAQASLDQFGASITANAAATSDKMTQKYAAALQNIQKQTASVGALVQSGALTEQEGIKRTITLKNQELKLIQDRAVKEGSASVESVAAIGNVRNSITALKEEQVLLGTTQEKTSESFLTQLPKIAANVFYVIRSIRLVISVIQGMVKPLQDAVKAWEDQEDAASKVIAVFNSTGAAAWTTSQHILGLGESLAKVTKYEDEQIQNMEGVLLGFTKIQGINFDRATEAVLNMATVMKYDLTSSAQAVGKALEYPSQMLDGLRRQGFRFTEEQKTMIKTLEAAGDQEGAQNLILDELTRAYGGAARAVADTDSALKVMKDKSLKELSEEVGRSLSGSGWLIAWRKGIKAIADAWAGALKESQDYKEWLAKNKPGETSTSTLEENLSTYNTLIKKLQKDQITYFSDDPEYKSIQDRIDGYKELIRLTNLKISTSESGTGLSVTDDATFKFLEKRNKLENDYEAKLYAINDAVKNGTKTQVDANSEIQSLNQGIVDSLENMKGEYKDVKDAAGLPMWGTNSVAALTKYIGLLKESIIDTNKQAASSAIWKATAEATNKILTDNATRAASLYDSMDTRTALEKAQAESDAASLKAAEAAAKGNTDLAESWYQVADALDFYIKKTVDQSKLDASSAIWKATAEATNKILTDNATRAASLYDSMDIRTALEKAQAESDAASLKAAEAAAKGNTDLAESWYQVADALDFYIKKTVDQSKLDASSAIWKATAEATNKILTDNATRAASLYDSMDTRTALEKAQAESDAASLKAAEAAAKGNTDLAESWYQVADALDFYIKKTVDQSKLDASSAIWKATAEATNKILTDNATRAASLYDSMDTRTALEKAQAESDAASLKAAEAAAKGNTDLAESWYQVADALDFYIKKTVDQSKLDASSAIWKATAEATNKILTDNATRAASLYDSMDTRTALEKAQAESDAASLKAAEAAAKGNTDLAESWYQVADALDFYIKKTVDQSKLDASSAIWKATAEATNKILTDNATRAASLYDSMDTRTALEKAQAESDAASLKAAEAAAKGNTDLAESWYQVADALDFYIKKTVDQSKLDASSAIWKATAEATNKILTDNATRAASLYDSMDTRTALEKAQAESDAASLKAAEAAAKGNTDLAESWYQVADALDFYIKKTVDQSKLDASSAIWKATAEATNKILTDNATRAASLYDSMDTRTALEKAQAESDAASLKAAEAAAKGNTDLAESWYQVADALDFYIKKTVDQSKLDASSAIWKATAEATNKILTDNATRAASLYDSMDTRTALEKAQAESDAASLKAAEAAAKGNTDLAESWYQVADALDFYIKKTGKTDILSAFKQTSQGQFQETIKELEQLSKAVQDASTAQEKSPLANIFDTVLDPKQTSQFDKWVSDNIKAGNDGFAEIAQGLDYDIKGYFKKYVLSGSDEWIHGVSQHFTDEFKKINHASFSSESMFSNALTPGGIWSVEGAQDIFTPSWFNIAQYGLENIKKYFAEYESGVQLVINYTQAQADEMAKAAGSTDKNTSALAEMFKIVQSAKLKSLGNILISEYRDSLNGASKSIPEQITYFEGLRDAAGQGTTEALAYQAAIDSLSGDQLKTLESDYKKLSETQYSALDALIAFAEAKIAKDKETIASNKATGESTKELEDGVTALQGKIDALKTDKAKKQFQELANTIINAFVSIMGSIESMYSAQAAAQEKSIEEQLKALEKTYGSSADHLKKMYEMLNKMGATDAANTLQAQYDKEKAVEDYAALTSAELQILYDAAIKNGKSETAAYIAEAKARVDAKQKAADQENMIAYQASLNSWNLQVLASIASAAQAVLNGYLTQPFIPAGLVAGSLAVGLGAAQVATVTAAKPVYYAAATINAATGGIVLPSDGGSLVNVAENRHAELLLNDSEQGLAVIRSVAAEIVNQMVGGAGGTIILQPQPIFLDGQKVAESTVSRINNGQVRLKR